MSFAERFEDIQSSTVRDGGVKNLHSHSSQYPKEINHERHEKHELET